MELLRITEGMWNFVGNWIGGLQEEKCHVYVDNDTNQSSLIGQDVLFIYTLTNVGTLAILFQ